MTELHIGQFFEQFHHYLQILQGLHRYLSSTDGALTACCIELIAYSVDRAEQGIVEGRAAGSAGIEVVGYITQGTWEKNIL